MPGWPGTCKGCSLSLWLGEVLTGKYLDLQNHAEGILLPRMVLPLSAKTPIMRLQGILGPRGVAALLKGTGKSLCMSWISEVLALVEHLLCIRRL